MCFFGQYSVFVNFLAKVLYCPKKTNPFLQKCCTVPKNPKKINFFRSWDLEAQFVYQLDWFFWDSTALLQKKIGFLGQYSVFVNFLAKVLYCPKKTNLFLQKCCTVPKKPKKTIFSSLVALRGPRTWKDCFFLVFLGQYTTLAKKDWFFWDSTVFLLIFLQKCCTVPKKPIFFCKSAVLFQKNQSCGRPVALWRLERIVFFGFFGTVQHFCKKGLVFLGQYSVFVNVLTNVLYCPKRNNHLLQKWSCRTSLTGSVP